MMPCNVVVYEGDDNRAVILAIDPSKTVASTGDPKLTLLANNIKEKLERALAKLE